MLKNTTAKLIGKKRYHNSKYKLNQDYFENINTHEKAYWLGFLAADGAVVQGKRSFHVYLEINELDKYHLENFVKTIGYTGPLKFREKGKSKTWAVRITSKKMFENLTKWGVVPNKTYKLNPPENLRENLKSSYILGYIDGDGSWWLNKRPFNKGQQLGFGVTSKTRPILEWIEMHFRDNGLKKKEIRTSFNKTFKVTQQRLDYGGNGNCAMLAKILYSNNVPCLKRKKDLVVNFLKSKGYLNDVQFATR